jgi:hypothetical protein
MYVQDNLLHKTTNVGEIFLANKFVLMFSALVAGPLVIFTLAWRDANAPNQPGSLGSSLVLALYLLVGVGGGFWRFTSDFHAAAGLSMAAHDVR